MQITTTWKEHRGQVPGLIWEKRATPSETTLIDQQLLDQGVPYHYRVRACTNNGECSIYRTIATDQFGYLAMPSPNNIRVFRGANGEKNAHRFSWDGILVAAYYRVYYSKNNIDSKVYEENKENFVGYKNYLTFSEFIVGKSDYHLIDRTWAILACSEYDICSRETEAEILRLSTLNGLVDTSSKFPRCWTQCMF